MLMVELLARMHDLRRRIQAEHTADVTGTCRECPGVRWPCELYQLATRADGPEGARALAHRSAVPHRPPAPPLPRQGFPDRPAWSGASSWDGPSGPPIPAQSRASGQAPPPRRAIPADVPMPARYWHPDRQYGGS